MRPSKPTVSDWPAEAERNLSIKTKQYLEDLHLFFLSRDFSPSYCACKVFLLLPSAQIFPWQVQKHMTFYTLLNPSAIRSDSTQFLYLCLYSYCYFSTGCFSFFFKSCQTLTTTTNSLFLSCCSQKVFWSSSSERSHVWALKWKRVRSRQSAFSPDTENYLC